MEAKETRDALVEKVARALMVPQVGTIPTYWKNKAEAVIPIIERDLLREMLGEPSNEVLEQYGKLLADNWPRKAGENYHLMIRAFARSRGYDLDQGETDGSV